MSRVFVGLMSGTSMDGVDAVACSIRGGGLAMWPTVLAHVHRPYPRDIREELIRVAEGARRHAADFCRLHWRLGHVFADAAERAVRAARINSRDIVAIGSHGQTISHVPPQRRSRARQPEASGTWQIAEPAVIAARLAAPVVSRFREADMAAGGQGAPLVPWTDFVLFAHRTRTRIVQNIGGIANLTWLPAGGDRDDVRAFDTGPGNMVIDALVQRWTGGRRRFDRNGRLAARGRVHEALLRQWLAHPYFARTPPKSCGREEFGESFLTRSLARWERQLDRNDILATATMLTARTIAEAYRRHLPQAPPEVILCGGGALNRTLRAMLADLLPWTVLRSIDEHGIAVQAKEPLSFAMLAAAFVDSVPANLPAVTGAGSAVVLGQLTPGMVGGE